MGHYRFGPLLIKRSLSLESTVRSMLVVLFLCSVCCGAAVAADPDGSTLLELKKSLSDPSGILSGWVLDSSGKGCCSWLGVTCDRNSRVVSLNVSGGVGNGAETPFLRSDSAQFPVYYHGVRRSCVGSDGKLVGKLSPAIANLSELRILALPFHGLYGGLPSEIWGMEKLEMIDLEGNSMGGSLPGQISGSKNLRVLNLGFNKISGEIPSSLSSLGSLEVLNLAGNSLNGSVPSFIGQLRAVHLSFNQFIGSIPSDIGKNCGKLEHLDLSGNFLGGRIPSSIGDCSGLRSLLVYSNMLEEEIPAALGRLMSLEVLDLSRNTLSGPVPSELGNCTNLSILMLSNTLNPTQPQITTGDVILSKFYTMGDEYNYYQGELPAEITILPKLRILWSPRANLEGNIPEMWGSCKSLEMVNLAQNLLLGKVPPQFNRCKNLRFLDLSSNRLYGEIAGVMDIPCMTFFNISGNALSGQLPRINGSSCLSSRRTDGNIDSPTVYLSSYAYSARGDYLPGSLSSDNAVVVYHDFSQNNFSGSLDSLPMVSERMGDRTLYVFSAKENDLSGPFPPNLLMNCDGAWDGILINVGRNRLSGLIPSLLGSSCKSLISFDASENQLSGTIPSSLGELNFVVALDLSWNALQGPIPAAFGNMRALKYLSLAGNRLSGSIPSTLGLLRYLEVLDLSSNSFSGGIPDDIVTLRCLKVLLLDNNSLSGHLPSNLKNATALVAFNVSLNNLSGPLPLNDSFLSCDDILGNNFSQPCSSFYLGVPSANLQSADSQNYAAPPVGSQIPRRSFNSIEIASISSALAIVSVLLALIVLCVYTRRMRRKMNSCPVRKELTVFNNIGVPLEFEDVVRATGGFNASNCIGNGGFGATYKAEVAPGFLVAVKRLAVGRFQGIQQFHAEIKTLGQLKHENLVTLIGYHASETEMFLIYNYLPGCNLERFIQERSNRPVDWRVLHKIALHVASALAYLHSKCVPRVLHRDVKPSNILLDNDHNAYLSDFGLARLLGTSETHATTGVAGTFGYVAPEYAMTCRVSDKADVYSYGVVLLELLSDKKALDPSFSSYGNGFNIVQWACMLLRQGRAKEFFVAGLWDIGPHDDLIEVMHLAVVCTVDSLSTRPTMKQVLQRLKQLQPPAG